VGPHRPARLLVVGDSVALSLGFGWPAAEPGYSLVVQDRGELGCGLADTPIQRDKDSTGPPPAWCAVQSNDWAAAVGSYNPDVVALLDGRWDITDHLLGGRWVHVGQPAFDAMLLGRLDAAVATLSARGARVALLTLPCLAEGEQPDGRPWPQDDPARVARYNELLAQAAAASGGRATVVDLAGHVCPAGRFAASAGRVTVRNSDGVHFTAAGSAWLAPWLFPQLRDMARLS
jgi:hypothetical protein